MIYKVIYDSAMYTMCPQIDTKFATKQQTFVTQHELMRLFEGDIKTDILNSTYCSISKNILTSKLFLSYSYQKL